MGERSDFNKLIGKHIKRLRKAKGLTQLDLAVMMGMDYQNISAYERGKISPSVYWIIELCVNLKTDPGDFIQDFFNDLYPDR